MAILMVWPLSRTKIWQAVYLFLSTCLLGNPEANAFFFVELHRQVAVRKDAPLNTKKFKYGVAKLFI